MLSLKEALLEMGRDVCVGERGFFGLAVDLFLFSVLRSQDEEDEITEWLEPEVSTRTYFSLTPYNH